MSKQYRISVVMPIYNTEDYLHEAIDSIVTQTIGFENIQLILVNDGSTDSSGSICKEYKLSYPENIIYIEKENGGVSSASNAGIAVADAPYINLFGSDDKWATDALETACDFFDEHYNEIDLVSCRLRFFGIKAGQRHPLDYRFSSGENRIAYLDKEYSCIQMMTGTCIFKAEELKTRRFSEKLAYAEDALMISDILLAKKAYGVLATAVYHYRRRDDGQQLSSLATKNKQRYLVSPREFILKMFDNAQAKCGEIPLFIQYTAMYECQWVFKEGLADNLTDEEISTYHSSLNEILNRVDDKAIIKQKYLNWPQRIALLKYKYGEERFEELLRLSKRAAWCGTTKIANLAKNLRILTVMLLEVENDSLILGGVFRGGVLGSSIELLAVAGKTEYRASLTDAAPYSASCFTGIIPGSAQYFRITIPLKGVKRVRFIMRNAEGPNAQLHPGFTILAKLTGRLINSYYAKDNYLLTIGEDRTLEISPNTTKRRLEHERLLEKEISHDGRFGKKIARQRRWALILRHFFRKPIWLLSDRFSKAGDNGENLFKYLSSIDAQSKYNIYFLFEPEYPDYQRLKRYGKVLDPHSKFFPIAFLMADKIISAHADATIVNPFKSKGYAVADMLDYDYVYIQHGVMPGNLSHWLNICNKNARLITTSAPREYEQLLLPEYGYQPENIALTGMPRHDALHGSRNGRKIVFLPTWREKLAGTINAFERTRGYVQDFKDTEYCQFYNRLINDGRLIDTMRRYGYSGEFYVHPSFEKQAGDFVGNDIISVGSGLANYESILNDAALMVTDYSSVAFDFGVQRKPVIYTQFDIDHIWDIHFYEQGYFVYEEDGFGPVCHEYEDCVNTIIKMIESDCEMPEKYKARCEKFFAYHDQNNSERVYKAICSIDEQRARSKKRK